MGSAGAAWLGGRLVSRFGRPLVVLGLVTVVVGLAGVDLVVAHVHTDVGFALAPVLLISGIGGGMVISPNVTLTLADVDVRHAGSGGGMLQTAQRVGSAIGVAIVLAQFFTRLQADHTDFTGALSHSLHTTIGFVALALVIGLADLVFGRGGNTRRRPASARGGS